MTNKTRFKLSQYDHMIYIYDLYMCVLCVCRFDISYMYKTKECKYISLCLKNSNHSLIT